MKKQDLKKLHALSLQQLAQELKKIRSELVTTSQEVKLAKQKNTSKLKQLRYKIAVINTIARAKELAGSDKAPRAEDSK